jgi:hypothetical protein
MKNNYVMDESVDVCDDCNFKDSDKCNSCKHRKKTKAAPTHMGGFVNTEALGGMLNG